MITQHELRNASKGRKILSYKILKNGAMRFKLDKGRWKPTLEIDNKNIYLLKYYTDNKTGKFYPERFCVIYPGDKYTFRQTGLYFTKEEFEKLRALLNIKR